MDIQIKECKHHGKSEFKKRSDGYYRCKKCAVDAVQKRRLKVKEDAVIYLGGECNRCGYDKCIDALEFHHIDPDLKEFSISHNGHTRSWERVKKELDKCLMVCSNCHKEIHYELRKGK
jgi:hypothetical protein